MVEITKCPICDNQSLQLLHQAKDYTATWQVFNILKCSNCELLITSPVPLENEIERFYRSESYISHTSRARNLTDQLYLIARKFTLRHKLSLVTKYSSTGKLLDYGCGTGDFLRLAEKKKWKAYGVEPSSTPIHNSATIVKNLSDLNIDGFDIITLWHVLEHIQNPNEVLQQLRDKINKNGTIFIAVPNFKSLDATYYKEAWAGYDVPRHLWHFSRRSMTRLLNKNNLRVIATKPMFLDAIYVSQLSERYLSNNQLTTKGFLRANVIGLRSNLFAAFHDKEYSSLIFVVKR
ncbi:MAG TPA: class I SAM-dependent methyltransferase [Cyclobacteriaceae bacterium]|nr:class I SAM-dependent methyltransferase [Cyclobacteriaceae bacterium]